MVDKINNEGGFKPKPKTSQKPEAIEKKRPSAEKAQERAPAEAQAVVMSEKSRGSKRMSKVLNSLDDAVSYSSLAVKSLKKITQGAEPAENNEFVRSVSDDLGKLQTDIEGVLSNLRERASTADIMRENLDASSVGIEDVERMYQEALDQARSLKDREDGGARMIDAHRGLDPDRVFQLLKV